MTKEIKLTVITLIVTAIIGGLSVVCSDIYTTLKERVKVAENEKETAIDYVYRMDSLFNVSQAHNKKLEKKFKTILDAHNSSKDLTNEEILIIQDSLFSRPELDSIRNTLKQ